MRILVVDDEPLIADLLASHLETHGHEVVVEHDGLAAAATWAGQRFDVLISDIKLPKLSGVDLVRKIRANGNGQPCILMSGHVEATRLHDESLLQPMALLPKPFSLVDFDAVISSALSA